MTKPSGKPESPTGDMAGSRRLPTLAAERGMNPNNVKKTPWWQVPDPGSNFVTDDLGRITLAVHRVDGPHPGRKKQKLGFDVDDKRPGDHKGHLGAEGLVNNTDRVNNPFNIVAESPDSNLGGSKIGGKRAFERMAEQIYLEYPESKVFTTHEPLYRGAKKRPVAMTHSIMNDKGEILYDVTILNKQRTETHSIPDQGGTSMFRDQ
jgi:hypothetical protein